jgi:hypothetical protein
MFDMAAKHVIANGPSWNPENDCCQYSGSGCAASVFILPHCRNIADKKGGAWLGMVNLRLASNHNIELIMKLQNCHDDACTAALQPMTICKREVNRENFFTRWQHDMKNLAKQRGLSSAAVDTIQ